MEKLHFDYRNCDQFRATSLGPVDSATHVSPYAIPRQYQTPQPPPVSKMPLFQDYQYQTSRQGGYLPHYYPPLNPTTPHISLQQQQQYLKNRYKDSDGMWLPTSTWMSNRWPSVSMCPPPPTTPYSSPYLTSFMPPFPLLNPCCPYEPVPTACDSTACSQPSVQNQLDNMEFKINKLTQTILEFNTGSERMNVLLETD